jgi:hypothetical protein
MLAAVPRSRNSRRRRREGITATNKEAAAARGTESRCGAREPSTSSKKHVPVETVMRTGFAMRLVALQSLSVSMESKAGSNLLFCHASCRKNRSHTRAKPEGMLFPDAL